ncbi:hypothetical protein CAPTEDRAFT_209199 [Capitella teleta]|uniref:Uncharacterized protein n=1 Tax=Capitella teleta TaxID=283909 RepID=R7VIH7_CAPTE|nr:hypothetical protein CAPTEDRAFT_209199 [Capitella teleta]|eukprot:ELU18643.1 hypothetical protein CAPTEDRAFT_209199 [Capitella teleta]
MHAEGTNGDKESGRKRKPLEHLLLLRQHVSDLCQVMFLPNCSSIVKGKIFPFAEYRWNIRNFKMVFGPISRKSDRVVSAIASKEFDPGDNTMLALMTILASTLVVAIAQFDEETVTNLEKRADLGPSCQRCLFHPEDSVSCKNCYRHPHGADHGFTERTSIDKRASSNFLTCRCCISLAARKCCDKCSLTPYYGKRSYEPALSAWQGGVRENCSCCDSEIFNYKCCNSSCSKRE